MDHPPAVVRQSRVRRRSRRDRHCAGGLREDRAPGRDMGAFLVAHAGDVGPHSRRGPRRCACPGGFEISVADLEIIGPSPLDYPIQPKEHGIDFLLDHRHFWLRSNRQRAIFTVRNEVEQAIHDFFYERGFLRVDTPLLTAAIGERSGLFETKYFDEGMAYLAQTGQLYGEAA